MIEGIARPCGHFTPEEAAQAERNPPISERLWALGALQLPAILKPT